MPLVLTSERADETSAIGAALAPLLVPGDVVALAGELGAGKTRLVQGIAAGLGITDAVTSPTFVLVRSYRGRLRLVHCDVYRLDRLSDVDDLGDEVLDPDAVTCIEWGDTVTPLLPEDRLEIEVVGGADRAVDGGAGAASGDGGTDSGRTLMLRALGPRWAERSDALAAAVAPWRAAP